MFTGTLIEELLATVERAEANVTTIEFDMSEVEPWFASLQESSEYETKVLGVA